MAKDKKKTAAATKVQPSAGKRKSGGAYTASVFTLFIVGLAFFAMPALLVFAVGMIPSLVAAIVDRHPGRNATIAVTAMNFAGVVPFVAEILISGASMARAMLVVTDVFSLAMMYGTAAFGWGLVYVMPKVASVYISVRNDARIQAMQREKKRLNEEWGDAVKSLPPVAAPAGRKKAGADAAKPA